MLKARPWDMEKKDLELFLEEVEAMVSVADNIESWSTIYGGYDIVKNHWAGESGIFDAAEAGGESWGIVWYIGHGDYTLVWYTWPYWHCETHRCITTDILEKVWDNEIYPHSAARRVHFAFLWSCFQGGAIGGETPTGWHSGMPYAWLHTTDLSSDGYHFPDGKDYTFIGWKDFAPYLVKKIAGVDHAGEYFVNNFYWAALHDKDKIIDALDHASYMNWGKFFDQCKFWQGWGFPIQGYMKVYGDGNLEIGG